MSWTSVWISLLALLIWLAVQVVFYFGRAGWREWRGFPASVPAETLRQKRDLATQVEEYLKHVRTAEALDEFIAGGRNTPGWTGPQQWLYLSRTVDLVKGQWSEEHEVEALRDSSMRWHRSVLTPEDDAVRLRAEAVWRMERLLKFLTRDLR